MYANQIEDGNENNFVMHHPILLVFFARSEVFGRSHSDSKSNYRQTSEAQDRIKEKKNRGCIFAFTPETFRLRELVFPWL